MFLRSLAKWQYKGVITFYCTVDSRINKAYVIFLHHFKQTVKMQSDSTIAVICLWYDSMQVWDLPVLNFIIVLTLSANSATNIWSFNKPFLVLSSTWPFILRLLFKRKKSAVWVYFCYSIIREIIRRLRALVLENVQQPAASLWFLTLTSLWQSPALYCRCRVIVPLSGHWNSTCLPVCNDGH